MKKQRRLRLGKALVQQFNKISCFLPADEKHDYGWSKSLGVDIHPLLNWAHKIMCFRYTWLSVFEKFVQDQEDNERKQRWTKKPYKIFQRATKFSLQRLTFFIDFCSVSHLANTKALFLVGLWCFLTHGDVHFLCVTVYIGKN